MGARAASCLARVPPGRKCACYIAPGKLREWWRNEVWVAPLVLPELLLEPGPFVEPPMFGQFAGLWVPLPPPGVVGALGSAGGPGGAWRLLLDDSRRVANTSTARLAGRKGNTAADD